jgi:Outer membrane protein beta-barrel domain
MKQMVLAIAALLLAAAPATALEQGLQEGHAAIGAMIPFGDFGDAANTGFLFGTGYGYWLTPRLQLGAQFDYHMFGMTDEFVAAVGADEDVDGNIFSYRAFGKYALMMEDSTPYLKLLLGFYSFGLGDYEVGGLAVETESETDFGFGAGLGYQYRGASNIGFFGEGVFNMVFNGSDGGDDSTFLNLRAGISLYWGGPSTYPRTGTGY